MIQAHDLSTFEPAPGASTAVTIGNFDGCHLGHQELIGRTRIYGEQLGATPLAITFTPRPEAFFRSLTPEALLFTEAQKTRAFAELGLAKQLVQRFDAEFARVTHRGFYHDLLRSRLKAAALVVGDNFHFGHRRGGDAAYLQEQAQEDGLQLTIGAALQYAGQAVSSTRIRATLHDQGDAPTAALMLGRPYLLEGVIAKGDQLGRTLQFPTANLGQVEQLLPRFGVYAGYVWLESNAGSNSRPEVMVRPATAVPAVFNLGVRPTVAKTAAPVRIEAHLLSGEYGVDALYGRRAGYYFAHRLRGEQAFSGLEALRQQISRDCDQARHLLGG